MDQSKNGGKFMKARVMISKQGIVFVLATFGLEILFFPVYDFGVGELADFFFLLLLFLYLLPDGKAADSPNVAVFTQTEKHIVLILVLGDWTTNSP